MLLTSLLIASATPLQPYTISTVDNYTTRVRVFSDTTVHMSNTQRLEVVIDNGKHVLKQGDGVKSYDIKVKRGDILNVTALGGFNGDRYKIGSALVNVYN